MSTGQVEKTASVA